MVAEPRPFLGPRPHADVHVVGLRKHPPVAAGNVGELDDDAVLVAVLRDVGVRHVPLERDAVHDRPAEADRLRRLAVRAVRTDDHVGRDALTAHLDRSVAVRDRTPSRTSTPRSRAASSRKASSRRRWVIQMTGSLRAAHDRVAVAEPELDHVDPLFDDGRRIDRAAPEGARRQAAAARLVAREGRPVGNEHASGRRVARW